MTLHESFVFRITFNSHILFYDEIALKNKIKCFDIKVLFYTTLYKSYMTPPISLQDAFIFNRIVKGKTKINCFHSKFSGQDLWNWTGDQRKFYRTLIADSTTFSTKEKWVSFHSEPDHCALIPRPLKFIKRNLLKNNLLKMSTQLCVDYLTLHFPTVALQ